MTQKRALPINNHTLWPLPVTTVLVSCVGEASKPNIITIAGCGIASSNPPLIGVAIGTGRYSLELIKETGDFVVNVPPCHMAEVSDWCGNVSGKDVDKFAEGPLTPGQSVKVRSPYIAECPVNFECVVWKSVECGSHDFVLGEIQLVHIDEAVLNQEGDALDPTKFQPLVSLQHQYWRMGAALGDWHRMGDRS